MISYGNKTTKAIHDRLKIEARNDLRKFSSNKLQRSCGLQPLSSVRVMHYKGRFRHDSAIACKNRNSCPWCTCPNLASQRTKLNAKAIHCLDMGGFVVGATLTLPKRNSSDLKYSYSVLLAQIGRFRRKARLIEKRFGVQESARTLEETYSESSFWHPHVNFCWFVARGMDEESATEMREQLLSAWISAATQGGIRGVQIAAQRFNTYRTDSSVKKLSRYITKHSYFPSKVSVPLDSRGYQGLQPWNILNLARTGETRWIAVWHDYEKALKGKRRVVFYNNRS